jgi:AAA+ superfamily predicted ATPase
MVDTTEAIANNSPLDELLPLLQRLDELLEQAVAAAQVAYGTETAHDPYRGLHVNSEDAEQLLQRKPAAPVFELNSQLPTEPISNLIKPDSRLARLIQTFGLSDFDLDVIAIALAPELDRRYDRLYAYLQDDVRCKHPSVDLALNLLCDSAADKLAKRSHFATDAPLIRHQLLHLFAENDRAQPTLLARELHLDDRVVRFLLQQPGLDDRLIPFCQLIHPTIFLANLPLNAETKQALATLSIQNWQQQKALHLYFQGTDRPGKLNTAEALATELKVPLLTVDLARIAENKTNFEQNLKLIFREAWFQNALLYLEGLDILYGDDRAIAHRCLMQAIIQHPTITILSGVQPWIPAATEIIGIITISFPIPDFAQRCDCWQTHLTAANIHLDNADLDALTNRFRLTSHQIASAVKSAENAVRWQVSMRSPLELSQITIDALFAAARAQSGHDLAELTRKIEPKYRWEDLVLPPDSQTQLREICNQEKYRHLVHETWGFDRKLSLGKGLNVLFSGSPGTGKTMAAEVLARELQLDLYKIDLSQVVSKYIGETEKNLNRIFTAATNSNAILFFDEADALFGKRSEVKDARDRYANIEIGYLLQKMEEYEGIAILTTNLRSNMDDAFVRRLRFIIEFPFPNQQQRHQIWGKILPDTTPRSPDLDLDFLARRFEITGANIRNIALAAAFLAADDGSTLSMIHLMQAIRREYQKMGKILMEEEFDRYVELN